MPAYEWAMITTFVPWWLLRMLSIKLSSAASECCGLERQSQLKNETFPGSNPLR